MLNGEVFGKVFKMHRQHRVEYTPVTSTSPSCALFVSSTAPRCPTAATMGIWHYHLGHLHAEALVNLPAAAEGVKITSSSLALCDTCALANAKQVSSRCSTQCATSVFRHVYLDLIQLNQAYNSNRWVLHFLNDFSRMNFVYTVLIRSQASDTVKHFAAFVPRQFEHRVKVFCNNNQRSLDKDFKTWITRKGIALELVATYTLTPIGAAERSRGVLTA
jgi:hypothetical protein